jgi:L-2-hydroxyglutarate oxidase
MKTDFLIVGAGIIGLTLARELANRKAGKIVVLEKESEVGKHASGRNSGVVHAGIYYPADSLKAQFCVRGAKLLLDYVCANNLPVLKCGKVIVATKPETISTLSTLMARAEQSGVEAKRITLAELRELEPMARSLEWAIWSPRTAVIDSKSVLNKLIQELQSSGVEIRYQTEIVDAKPSERKVRSRNEQFTYGHLFNTAGTYADAVAHMFGVGMKYQILPFKGMYWNSTPAFAKKIQRLIYPAPDITMPFLGVHITRTIDGHVLFGPTAVPALGRENYSGLENLKWSETPSIGWQLTKLLGKNSGNLRKFVKEEISRYNPRKFFAEAKSLVEDLNPKDIGAFYKVGIRAQLVDTEKNALQMDFVIEKGEHSLHVLNAISPAFTSSFAFAEHLADLA